MSAFKKFEVVILASPLGEGDRMKVRDLIPAVAADKPSPPPPPFVRGLSLAPKVVCHFEPGASPQEFELLSKQGLKARFSRASQSNSALVMDRAFSPEGFRGCPRLKIKYRAVSAKRIQLI
jgi:hypothetical protein